MIADVLSLFKTNTLLTPIWHRIDSAPSRSRSSSHRSPVNNETRGVLYVKLTVILDCAKIPRPIFLCNKLQRLSMITLQLAPRHAPKIWCYAGSRKKKKKKNCEECMQLRMDLVLYSQFALGLAYNRHEYAGAMLEWVNRSS